MHFLAEAGRRLVPGSRVIQTLRMMKLTAFFLLVACIQVSANGNAQTISITEKNVPLQKVFREIQKQTTCDFVYSPELLQQAGNVSVTVRNASLDQVMQLCLKDKPLHYVIFGKTIVISPKTPAPERKPAPVHYNIWGDPVTGVVVDSKGSPIPNASIVIKRPGKTTGDELQQPGGTQSNMKGEFVLPIFSGKVLLTVSSVGFGTKEMYITDDTKNLRVVLTIEETKLDELVITGYSTKKVREVTGSVQTLSGNEVRSGITTANTLAMLKGKMGGLYIVESGSSNGSVANRGQVIMRGQATLNDNSNTNFGPLIVLDGVITTATSLQDIVDASDIESITLLKDAASTAIYGSRAAQGVIVVNTRRGSMGKLSVNLVMNYGTVKNNRLVGFMNTPQQAAHITKYMQALYAATPSLQNSYGSFQNYFNTTRIFTDDDLNTNFDWSNSALFSDGHQSNVNLSLQSGTDKTKFYGAINWTKQDGTLLDDRLDRKNVRFNIDQKINNRISVSINANAILDKYTASSGENQPYVFEPWVSPYKADGTLADSVPNYVYKPTGSRVVSWYSNPLYHHEWNTTITQRHSYLGTGIIKYAVTPWLTLQSTNTFNYIYNNVNTYRDPRTYRGKYNGPSSNPIYMNGELFLTDNKNTYFLTSNLISFNKRFGDHQVTALAGEEYGKTHGETIAISGYNTPYPGERNLGAFTNYGNGPYTWIYVMLGLPFPQASPASVDKASFSLFSEINDNYKGKYFGSVSLRRDASTNFGRLKRYGNFYSLSGAWLVSREAFMNTVRPISNLKLRASYGTSGREAGADFLNFTVYQESVNYGYNSTSTTGAAIQRLANDEITWETTYTGDVGFDIGLWKRINLTVDFYNRRSSGLLQATVLPSYQGSLTQVRNVGELVNRGVDIQLSTTNIQTRAFSWTTDLNFSLNRNKLTKLYGDSLIDAFSNSYYRYKGEDVNTMRAIKYAGVNPDNGRPQFERVMPDNKVVLVDSLPLVKQDGLRGFKRVGSATPKFYGGFTNTFRYKNITLSLLFNYVYGNVIFNNSVRNFISPDTWLYGQNTVQPNKAIRLWQGPGDTKANYPNYYEVDQRGSTWGPRGATNLNSSLLYQDASYMRLRNARLGYDLPATLLSKVKVRSVNVYISADNVFVIKSKELYAADPEGAVIGSSTNSYSGSGIYSAMPRKFIAGINVGF